MIKLPPNMYEDEGGGDDWMTTYGDMVTLLLCFFVLLLSMSTIDPAKFERTTANLTEVISGEKPLMPLDEVIKRLKKAVRDNRLENEVHIDSDGSGVVIEFSSSLLFESAQAEIRAAGIPVLKDMMQVIVQPEYERYGVEVEGHTDDVPINTTQFPSNWELSSARATSVVRLFQETPIDKRRLRAIGYADTLPKKDNINQDGSANWEHRALNRRIVMRMYPMTLRERSIKNSNDLSEKKRKE